MTESDWPVVAAIYRDGIATGEATFETDVPEWSTWDASHLPQCRIVAESSDGVVGWAALSPVSSRCVYGGVGEVSVYIAAAARGVVVLFYYAHKSHAVIGERLGVPVSTIKKRLHDARQRLRRCHQ